MNTGMRHQDYVKFLLEKRKQEQRKIDPIHETGEKITSPPSATTLEENRLLMEYMEQVNIQKIANSVPHMKHSLFLKKFFKMKRNEKVVVFVKDSGKVEEVMGRVKTIGRDFVMLTNLTNRVWIPYEAIESANIPLGIPPSMNSHQSPLYDNELKRKLITNFGGTVSKREALIQQFYEESIRTNLNTWKGQWVKVISLEKTVVGRIENSHKKGLILKGAFGSREIPWKEIIQIHSSRLLSRWNYYAKNIEKRLSSLFKINVAAKKNL